MCESHRCRELSPESAAPLDFIELYKRLIERHCFSSFCHSPSSKIDLQDVNSASLTMVSSHEENFCEVIFRCLFLHHVKRFLSEIVHFEPQEILQKFVTELEKMS